MNRYKRESKHNDFLKVLGHFKGSIFLAVLFGFLFSAIISYFSPDVFQSETTIKIYKEHEKSSRDFMSLALGLDSNNIDHEIDMLKSRLIISKALENLNLGIRYYEEKNLKKLELYKDAPFVVTPKFIASQQHGAEFTVKPISTDRFRLILEPGIIETIKYNIKHYLDGESRDNKLVSYDAVHSFGEPVVTPWFNITIQKIHQLDSEKYSFSILPNEKMHKFIAKRLQVSTLSKKSIVVRLRFNDSVALRAQEIVNTIANSYLQETLHVKTQSANKTLYFLDRQLEAINKTLQSSAENLQKYKVSNVVINVGEKAQLTAEKLSALESERSEVNMQLSILENILSYMKTHDDISGIDLGSNRKISESIDDLVVKIQEVTTYRNSLLVDYTELHPDVLKESEKLLSLASTLQQKIRSTIDRIKKRRSTLNWMIKQHKSTMSSFPQQERELSQLTRNFLVNEKIYSFLLQKRAETAIVASSTVSETRVIDSALLPEKPMKPNRLLIIALGVILGFISGVVYAFIRMILDDTLKNVKEIEKRTKIPVYGSIPLLDSDKKIDPFLESLRVVRTNLDFIQAESSSKLVTITSSIPSEGKTTISVELSKVIAQGSKKVLLIDLDMRRSTVHKRLNLKNEIGMSTLLSGRNTIDEVIQKSAYDSLDVIPAGPIPPNPSELIMLKEFKFSIDNLLHKYDYVVLDSPPVNVVTDGMILMNMSDMNLFVFKANFSKKDSIEELNVFVEKYNLKNVGIILNSVPLTKRLKYGYEYGYYHAKSKK
ncbi:MAG: polysaccharide biosynthesis tyrosine autokinase [Campylobacterota bacterium]|nr:polysaccharide biosynthesis tyrosine autokinase [Campylobacterota bacterium]